jgi:hypothetical protein
MNWSEPYLFPSAAKPLQLQATHSHLLVFLGPHHDLLILNIFLVHAACSEDLI